jgi:hypothetical protein
MALDDSICHSMVVADRQEGIPQGLKPVLWMGERGLT